MPAKERWRNIAGPTVATVAALLDAGWKPLQPSLWLTASGLHIANLELSPPAPLQIKEAFAKEAAQTAWLKASARIGGGGLQLGPPCFEIVRMTLDRLRKQGRFLEAVALQIAAVGGVWVNQRFKDTTRHFCSRCASAVGSPLHRY